MSPESNASCAVSIALLAFWRLLASLSLNDSMNPIRSPNGKVSSRKVKKLCKSDNVSAFGLTTSMVVILDDEYSQIYEPI